MCVKNVNVTGTLFKNIDYDNSIKSFEMPFDTITATTIDGKLCIQNFALVLNFCLLGTNQEDCKKQNIINQRSKFEVLIQLSKVDKNKEKQLQVDLTSFELDIGNKNDIYISHACVDYVTFRKSFSIGRIYLDEKAGLGEYVFKILVKSDIWKDDDWKLQSYIPLRIE